MVRRHVWTVLAGLLLTAGAAFAQGGTDLILQALDEPVSLDISEAPITEVLRQIHEQTGLRVILSDEAAARLPHGGQTRLRLQARNATLRQALERIIQPVSLRMEVTPTGVVLHPSDELLRIGRRPTFNELAILAALAGEPLEPGAPVEQQLRKITGDPRLQVLWHAIDPAAQQRAQARGGQVLAGGATGKEYLDAATHGANLTWYVWDDTIMILPREMQAMRQLDTRVTLRYQNQRLLDILNDLARQAHLELTMEPGVLNYLPPERRENVTLLLGEQTVQQALEAISGATGLEFRPDGLGIRVMASDELVRQATGRPRTRPAYILRTTVTTPEGRQYDVYFRPEELPPEMDEQVRSAMDDELQRIWQRYGYDGSPATEPSIGARD